MPDGSFEPRGKPRACFRESAGASVCRVWRKWPPQPLRDVLENGGQGPLRIHDQGRLVGLWGLESRELRRNEGGRCKMLSARRGALSYDAHPGLEVHEVQCGQAPAEAITVATTQCGAREDHRPV